MVAAAGAAEPVKIAMTSDQWTVSGLADFVQRDGFDAIALKPGDYAKKIKTGQAVLNNFTFRDGNIKYDVEATTCMGAGSASGTLIPFLAILRIADQLDGIESITSIRRFVQLAAPAPKFLLPTNRLTPGLIRWCYHY